MNKRWITLMGLLLMVAVIGTFSAGCESEKDKAIRQTSSEIKKLIAESLSSLPQEAQDNFTKHFNSLSPDAKKNLAGQLVKRMAMPPESPDARTPRERFGQMQKRLMNIPPEKRREAFQRFAQKYPQMADRMRQTLSQGGMRNQGGQFGQCPYKQKSMQMPDKMKQGQMKKQGEHQFAPPPQKQHNPNQPNRPPQQQRQRKTQQDNDNLFWTEQMLDGDEIF